ncbi:J domain-containing protein [Thermodesulfobacterium sp. TA1]|uniref:DnaJ C-terminal domain-containing protein n=1 Tax=Thermodesulfobacterium sp. TA1 TaxID=2234087 RepID=UPI0012329FED|nr:DnaJ C-terminal domain-containing protein [Thermodesulfobacterium sp. TA1]QER42116.1 J domain-containing protein [Thermodesulfobacterium sp. TA1]
MNFKQFSSFEEAKRFFRERVKKLHPDRGGNKEEFLELIKNYEEFFQSYQKISKIKVLQRPILKGNYFFSVLELTVEEVALGGKKKVEIPGEERVCPKCEGLGKKREGPISKCGFCKGVGFVETFDQRKETISYLTCPYCKGQGVILTEKCDECKGKGYVKVLNEFWLDLPLGLKEGDYVFVEKEILGVDYDLYLEVIIKPHPYFSLQNGDLIYRCQIPFWEVLIEDFISIKTLEGEERVPSKLFTEGRPVILKGRGPFLPDGKRGNLIVEYQIYLPQNLTQEAKELLKKLVDLIEKN